ncbi:MAG: SMP-30/gluconolactonase/LRE family protein [Verrucomicrobiales bacterium]|nr:SMP-30/gluconolactonase/LRE family protein [Verrucomicrobiales bacterium]
MRILFLLCFAPLILSAQTDGYRIETIPNPTEATSFDVTGLDMAKDGRVFCATRLGEIWVLEKDQWTRFAEGLHEPCGLLCEADGSVVVSQKPEVTRLVDSDKDGVADRIITVADEFEYHDNYHEFNHGLVRDADGWIYGALNLDHGNPDSFTMGGLGSPGGLRGTFYRISPEGDYETYAWGARSPAGLGMSPENELFYTDNQGNWVPTSFIGHVDQGSFQAEPTSLRDHPDYGIEKLKTMTPEDFAAIRKVPAVFLPHQEIANSPGNLVWDETGGKFGPFAGQALVVDLTQSNLCRVILEKVGGRYQGAVLPFLDGFQSGNIRQVFDEEGALWIGQTSRGWGARGPEPYGLQKVVWDGSTTPFEVKTISLQSDGFELTFTKPVETESLKKPLLQASSWWYHYHSTYGSPKVDEKAVTVESVAWNEDKTVATVRLPLDGERVYHLVLSQGLKAADGSALGNTDVYYTLVHLRESGS